MDLRLRTMDIQRSLGLLGDVVLYRLRGAGIDRKRLAFLEHLALQSVGRRRATFQSH